MNKYLLLLAVAPIALATPAIAQEASTQSKPATEKGDEIAKFGAVLCTGRMPLRVS